MRLRVLFAVVLVASGCSMVESEKIRPPSEIFAERGLACDNEAGFYFLPKTLLQVAVYAENKKGTGGVTDPKQEAEWHAIQVMRRRVPDARFGYCLDYLRSPTSDDVIRVAKYEGSPILGVVGSQALDQTGFILRTLIQTLFVGISGNPNFSPDAVRSRTFWKDGAPIKVFTAEFDPFDPYESARINQGLQRYGFCLLLGGHMFDLKRARIDSYCDEPAAVFRRAPVAKLEYRYAYEKVKGIYYRPRIPYNLYLFTKKNMLRSQGRYQVAGGWALRKTTPVTMENISPVVSIGMERTAFAERKTTLVFDEGELRDTCVFKTSELVEFAKIPLQITQSVVALPANIIQVRVNEIDSESALVAAQNRVIAAQIDYLKELNDIEMETPAAGDIPARRTQAGANDRLPNDWADRLEETPDSEIAQGAASWNDVCKTDQSVAKLSASDQAAGPTGVGSPIPSAGIPEGQ